MINNTLLAYVDNQSSVPHIVELAKEFEELNNLSASANYYFKAAELAEYPEEKSNYLYKTAESYFLQGDRFLEVKLLLSYALGFDVHNLNAWILICKIDLLEGEWITLLNCTRMALAYNGEDKDLLALQSISYYKLSKFDKSNDILTQLRLTNEGKKIIEFYYTLAKVNVNKYDRSRFGTLRTPLEIMKYVNHNYSDNLEDLLVLTLMNGNRGNYLNIGYDKVQNNTQLLEDLSWYGLSICSDKNLSDDFNYQRRDKSINLDFTQINYGFLLNRYYVQNCIQYLDIKFGNGINIMSLVEILKHNKTLIINLNDYDIAKDEEIFTNMSRDYQYKDFGKSKWMIHKDIKIDLSSYETISDYIFV